MEPAAIAGLPSGSRPARRWRRPSAAPGGPLLVRPSRCWPGGPVSNLPFPIDAIFGERLLYLPARLLRAPGDGSSAWPTGGGGRRPPPSRRCWCSAGACAASRRNLTWHDERSLASPWWRAHPTAGARHGALGTAYASVGRDDDALRELLQALGHRPEGTGALYNAGVIYQRRGEWLQALTVLPRRHEPRPDVPRRVDQRRRREQQPGHVHARLDAATMPSRFGPMPRARTWRGARAPRSRATGRGADAFQGSPPSRAGATRRSPRLGATAIDRRDFGEAARHSTACRDDPLGGRLPRPRLQHRMAGRGADAARVTAARTSAIRRHLFRARGGRPGPPLSRATAGDGESHPRRYCAVAVEQC